MLARLKTLAQTARTHAGFRRYAANTSWMFAEQMLRMVAGLLVGIWVARYLGPEQFGLFSYAVAFAALFGSLAKLGLDGIVVRDLVRNPELRDVYLGTAFWLKMIGAGFMLSTIAVAMHFTTSDDTTKLYIFIIACGSVFQAFEVIDFYFQSKVLSKFVSICRLTQLFISSFLKLYLIYTDAELLSFVLVGVFDQATLAVTLLVVSRKEKIINSLKCFESRIAIKLLSESWPLVLSGLVLMVQARVDQLFIKNILGNVEVGYYSSALRIVEVFNFVPVILVNSLFPSIINSKDISMDLYLKRLSQLYRLMTVVFLFFAIPIFCFGEKIVNLLYGKEYFAAGILLSYMSIRLFFGFFGVVRSAFLVAEKLSMYNMWTMVFGALLNIILNFLLVPIYHSIGAVLAFCISFILSTFLIDAIYIKAKINFRLMLYSLFLLKFRI
jgi:O-antigen/teichoic acid export membrane protein